MTKPLVTVCRRCKADLTFPAEVPLWPCAYCGAMNSRPEAKAEEDQQLLTRAKQEMLGRNYTEAEKAFREYLYKFPDSHEALWGRLLCEYGVEYVKDTVTGRLMPTVHFTHFGLFQKEPDLERACQLASPVIAGQYREDARYIDDVQAAIREKVRNGAHFDVFICHKTTKRTGLENGIYQDEYTWEYHKARDLYDMLTAEKYSVFFAPKAGLKPGADYEAGIYHALNVSKVLLLVCGNGDYLKTAWVKSEWSRYLEMQAADESKVLLPLYYGDFKDSALPDELRLRKLQAIRMGELTSKDKLLDSLKEYIGEAYSPEEDFETLLTGEGCQVLRYTGKGGHVSVPPSIRGEKVTAVAAEAFAACTAITQLTLPDCVKTVGQRAFAGCSGMTHVTLPAGLIRLESEPFRGCGALRSIHIAASNAAYELRQGALCSREGVLVCCPAGRSETEYAVPDGVREIAAYAFFGCAELTGVTVPGSVRRIGDHAFDGCGKLELLQLPAREPEMGEGVFDNCQRLMEKDFQTDTDGADGCIITRYTGRKRAVNVPGSIGGRKVTGVGVGAFENCFQLEELTLPEGVTSLADSAFLGCASLRVISLPETLQRIGSMCFGYCEFLTELRIPAGVTALEDSTFSGCDRLASVTLPPEMKTFNGRLTYGCPRLVLRVRRNSPAHMRALELELPCEELCTPEKDFRTENTREGCVITKYTGRDEHVIVPSTIRGEKVVTIGTAAFHDVRGLADVVLPDGVVTLGRNAFFGCGSLRSVELPGSLKTIGWRSFGGCTSLARLEIPEGVERIENGAFDGCGALMLIGKANGAAHRYAQRSGMNFEALPEPVVVEPVRIPVPRTETHVEPVRIPVPRTETRVEPVRIPVPRTETHVEPVRIPVPVQHRQTEDITPAVREMIAVLESRMAQLQRAAAPVTPRTTSSVSGAAPEYETTRLPGGGCSIVRYNGYGDVVTIPGVIGGQPVRMIGANAFARNLSLRRVTLPGTLTDIGSGAFSGCTELECVYIPGGVNWISENAFLNCGSVKVYCQPDSYAERFARQKSLPVVAMGGNAAESSGASAKKPANPAKSAPKDEFESIAVPGGCLITAYKGKGGDVIVPEGIGGQVVLGISVYAFARNLSIRSVTLPVTLRRIDGGAFSSCTELQSVYMPDSVTKIADDAFRNCSGVTIYCHPDTEAERFAQRMSLRVVHIGGKQTQPAQRPGRQTTQDTADAVFTTSSWREGCAVTRYKGSAENVTVPGSFGGKPVLSIGVKAFANHAQLSSVTLPGALIRIGACAFEGCRSLRRIYVPAALKELSADALRGAAGAKVLWYTSSPADGREDPAKLATMLGQPLKDTESKSAPYTNASLFNTIIAGNGIVITGYTGSANAVRIPSRISGKTVVAIGAGAFASNQVIQSVELPPSVQTIGENAFRYCEKLKEIRMPGVTKMGVYAFAGSGIRSVEIPGQLAEISNCAFQHCVSLQKVHIPGGVKKIGGLSFDGCTALTDLTIDEGVTEIVGQAFHNCKALRQVTLPESIKSTGMFIFQNCTSLQTAIVKSRMTELNEYFFSGCTSLTQVKLPPTLEKIAAHAFDGCSALQYLVIPANVKAFGQNAFDGCDKLPESIRSRSRNTMIGKIGKWFFGS